MYVNAKSRKNKKDVKVFYLYVAESHRVNGKVQNTQKYFGSISELDLVNDDLERLEESFDSGKWNQDEIDEVMMKIDDLTKKLIEEQSERKEIN